MTGHQLVVMGADCSRLIREPMRVREETDGCRKQVRGQGGCLYLKGVSRLTDRQTLGMRWDDGCVLSGPLGMSECVSE